MELRSYLEKDANIIITWIKNERELILWSADIYNTYPITANDINSFYKKCHVNKNFYPLTLIKDDKVIGHITLRYPTKDKKIIRLGFIIVDPKYRGKKFGKEMIIQAMEYAKNNLGVEDFNLGVFENNISACKCYESVGFKQVHIEKEAYTFKGEKWNCIEMVLKNRK